ncbi:metallophosphoesterase family protein [Salipiger marinus]|uniref:Serine/threonine protein phosphatase 1 n=1 Tax=Salipiger marinus TaxID=555512 RepID=A0A1G8QKB0_9RHOB|nr:metallophosphoesterase family protein [Salipiger marinus]SDJ05096.1 serine/threonine protein phosphatase 1 [Salipiger marinus]
MKILSHLFRAKGSGQAKPAFDAPLAPDRPFCAIGDIHGSLPALEALLSKIESLPQVPPVICLGDYMDRGEQSAQALTRLWALAKEFGEDFVCLKGNHEQMCLDFLENPEEGGEFWLRHGGLQTLASYGIGHRPGQASHRVLRDKLADAMGPDLLDWLAGLPLSWQSGNVVVVHAGLDPALPLAAQRPSVLMWGHPEFEKTPRRDGLWVVHGHTIVPEPQVVAGRIATDTGAYATGRLSAAHVSMDGVTFLTNL